MDATVDRIMTAPINTIIVVLIPVVNLHLGLPEKTKIYALLLEVQSISCHPHHHGSSFVGFTTKNYQIVSSNNIPCHFENTINLKILLNRYLLVD